MTRRHTTAELLLDLLNAVSLGATPAAHAARELRASHGPSNLSARVGRGLAMLEAEQLVGRTASAGEERFYATAAGQRALEQRGRYRGDATVLFTDIVGSTELIGTFGEAGAHERRQRHFALLRGAIARHDGREIKSLGDGLMVVFARPSQATACAAAMQRLIAADDHQLGLRVGIHTGELLREDGDCYGTTVIIARRLCDSADAGQIVLSDDTRALTKHATRSLGQLALKGLAQPVAACTLWWAERATPSACPAAA